MARGRSTEHRRRQPQARLQPNRALTPRTMGARGRPSDRVSASSSAGQCRVGGSRRSARVRQERAPASPGSLRPPRTAGRSSGRAHRSDAMGPRLRPRETLDALRDVAEQARRGPNEWTKGTQWSIACLLDEAGRAANIARWPMPRTFVEPWAAASRYELPLALRRHGKASH